MHRTPASAAPRPFGRLGALVATAGLLLAACGGGADDAAPPPSTTPPPSIGWVDVATVDLGGGWTVADGEGNAPTADVLRDGQRVGIVELSVYPISSIPAIADRVRTDEKGALEAYVGDFLGSLPADRSQTCGAGYTVTPRAPEHIVLPDGPAVRYGFDGAVPGRPVTERVLQWGGIRGDVLVIVVVAAYDPESCIATDGGEMTTAELAAVEARLGRAIENSALGPVIARVVDPRATG